MPTFAIHTAFRLPTRPGLFLVGSITDGTIRTGMLAHVPVSDGRHLRVPILGVEFVDYPGGIAHLALRVVIGDAEEEKLVEAKSQDGMTITVVESDGAGP